MSLHGLVGVRGMRMKRKNPLILSFQKGFRESLVGKSGEETVLEYRGQWQPKPNGAETGETAQPQGVKPG